MTARRRRATGPNSGGTGPIWTRPAALNRATFGAILRKPDFKGLDAFDTAIGELDTVAKRPAMYKAANNRAVDVEHHHAIVGQMNGDVYGYVSDSYVPVQDWQVLKPLYEAIALTGVKAQGSLVQARGRLYGYVLLTDADSFSMHVGDDELLLGVRAFNSYNAETSFGAEAFGVRVICSNGLLGWGSVMGEIRARHQGDLEKLLESFTGLFNGMLRNVPKMEALLENALTVEVELADVEDLLWGLKTGSRLPKTVAPDLETYAPEIGSLGLNGYTLYNAVTAYVTWRSSGVKYLGGVENDVRAATALLTENHDAILERGRVAREAYEEKVRKREEAKAAKALAAGK